MSAFDFPAWAIKKAEQFSTVKDQLDAELIARNQKALQEAKEQVAAMFSAPTPEAVAAVFDEPVSSEPKRKGWPKGVKRGPRVAKTANK